ncbi:MAG TPA: glycoside hydrolase family 1 protein [Candidatus Binatia bacterium]|nr:glycoside hydrolase family 1 protein [Candidatus Binatia bacterium]
MIDRTLEFPRDFVWGSATAAHQVEGDNRHNDWWAHELAPTTNAIEPSGVACDHYHRFAEDFRLCRSLGHAAHRMSIEWSRIEPSEGQINRSEIEHYRKVLGTLRDTGMEPWVTLHHFTSPVWFAQRGGFSKRENLDAFRRFVELAAREYGDLVRCWCTINEPTVVAELGFRFGYFPPRLQDPALSAAVLCNLFRAHTLACETVKAHAAHTPFIGITLAVQAHEPLDPSSDGDRALAARRDAESTGACYEALRTGVFRYPGRPDEEIAGLKASSSFVGVQYYTRMRYDANTGGPAPADFERRTITQMAWEVYPEGFAPLLRRAAATGLPVYVTENGVCLDDDRQRVEYIADHLAVVEQVRRDGGDVRGYFYWSAMDNFEWNFGYGPKFGLIEVDRKTLERRPRPSASFFAEVARTGRVSPELVQQFAR